eukprot:413624-Pelagomonas_calceolata.AAC.1
MQAVETLSTSTKGKTCFYGQGTMYLLHLKEKKEKDEVNGDQEAYSQEPRPDWPGFRALGLS